MAEAALVIRATKRVRRAKRERLPQPRDERRQGHRWLLLGRPTPWQFCGEYRADGAAGCVANRAVGAADWLARGHYSAGQTAMRVVTAASTQAAAILGPGGNGGLLYELADAPATIHSMDIAYATPIALGIALARPQRRVFCNRGRWFVLRRLDRAFDDLAHPSVQSYRRYIGQRSVENGQWAEANRDGIRGGPCQSRIRVGLGTGARAPRYRRDRTGPTTKSGARFGFGWSTFFSLQDRFQATHIFSRSGGGIPGVICPIARFSCERNWPDQCRSGDGSWHHCGVNSEALLMATTRNASVLKACRILHIIQTYNEPLSLKALADKRRYLIQFDSCCVNRSCRSATAVVPASGSRSVVWHHDQSESLSIESTIKLTNRIVATVAELTLLV